MSRWFARVMMASAVGASAVGASVVGASVGIAQVAQQPKDSARRGGPPPMMMGHRMHGGAERDQVVLLLDKQLALQLSAQQVNQLMTIHEQERQQVKPIFAKMKGLLPKDREGWKNVAPATWDSVGSLHEQLREIQWRQVSAASAVLTDEQKKIAARLTERPWFVAHE
jgi:hypothetical protein